MRVAAASVAEVGPQDRVRRLAILRDPRFARAQGSVVGRGDQVVPKLGRMKKLLIVGAALAVIGHFAWRWWLQSNADNARAWAAGTDRVR